MDITSVISKVLWNARDIYILPRQPSDPVARSWNVSARVCTPTYAGCLLFRHDRARRCPCNVFCRCSGKKPAENLASVKSSDFYYKTCSFAGQSSSSWILQTMTSVLHLRCSSAQHIKTPGDGLSSEKSKQPSSAVLTHCHVAPTGQHRILAGDVLASSQMVAHMAYVKGNRRLLGHCKACEQVSGRHSDSGHTLQAPASAAEVPVDAHRSLAVYRFEHSAGACSCAYIWIAAPLQRTVYRPPSPDLGSKFSRIL